LSSCDNNDWRRVLRRVELARVDAAFLRESLADVVAAAAPDAYEKNPNAFELARTEAIARFAAKPDLAQRAEELVGDEMTAAAAEEDAGHLRKLVNSLQSAERYWRNTPADRDGAAAAAVRAERELAAAATEAARLLVPCEAKAALLRLRVGRPLDFRTRFRHLAPDDETQKELLGDLASRPMELPGVVDVENGILYRISPSRELRLLTAAIPLLAMLATFPCVVLVDRLNDHHGSKLIDRSSLVATYGAVVAGALVHLIVERTKSLQVFGSPRIYVPGDALIWMHLRWASLCFTLIPIIGVWIAVWQAHQRGLLTFFFSGYSVDSIWGLVASRVTSRAGARISGMRATLGLNTGTQASGTASPTA